MEPTLNAPEGIAPAEWQARVDLAACYRLIALYGWDDLIFTHISARVPDHPDQFLINPYGMLFEEITPASLVKVDHRGEPLEATEYRVNPAGFNIHGAIHAVREDAHCVLHSHTVAGVAVSAQAEGLLPLSQQASVVMGDLAYHDYEGIALNPEEQARLQADLGTRNYLILRNHGLLVTAPTVADAFLRHFVLQRACEIQLQAQAGGNELVWVPQPILDGMAAQVQAVTASLGGALAWPALLRKLDRLDPRWRG